MGIGVPLCELLGELPPELVSVHTTVGDFALLGLLDYLRGEAQKSIAAVAPGADFAWDHQPMKGQLPNGLATVGGQHLVRYNLVEIHRIFIGGADEMSAMVRSVTKIAYLGTHWMPR